MNSLYPKSALSASSAGFPSTKTSSAKISPLLELSPNALGISTGLALCAWRQHTHILLHRHRVPYAVCAYRIVSPISSKSASRVYSSPWVFARPQHTLLSPSASPIRRLTSSSKQPFGSCGVVRCEGRRGWMWIQHNPTRRTEGKTGAIWILFLGCRWETWKHAWFACGSSGHLSPRSVGTLGHRDSHLLYQLFYVQYHHICFCISSGTAIWILQEGLVLRRSVIARVLRAFLQSSSIIGAAFECFRRINS